MDDANETFDEWEARQKREWDARKEASRLFNYSAVDRIVTAVGKPLPDRTGFANELERLASIRSFWRDVNDQPPDSAVRNWLESCVSQMRKARILLTHPPGDDPDVLAKLIFLAGQDRHDISQVGHVVEAMQILETILGRTLRHKSYGLDRIGPPNADVHWLIGEALPKVYTQYFGDKFGYSRNKEIGVPSGPGIRFILEVLSTMQVTTPRDGRPFGPESVEHYLRSARD